MMKIENYYTRPAGIQTSIHELKSLMFDDILPLDRMTWWLIKYDDLYKKVCNFHYNQYLYETEKGEIIRLPDSFSTDEDLFIDLFERLNEIYSISRLEKLCEQEIKAYEKIAASQFEIKNWVMKNEKMGTDRLSLISDIILELEDDINKILICEYDGFSIFTRRKDFIYTEKYLNIFHDLFWNKMIYPESKILKRLDNL